MSKIIKNSQKPEVIKILESINVQLDKNINNTDELLILINNGLPGKNTNKPDRGMERQ